MVPFFCALIRFFGRPFRCEWSVLLIWKDLTFAFSYVIIGGVVAGAGWYLGRLALGPSGASMLVAVPFEHPADHSCSYLDQE